jgi:hypothetical protein
MSISPFHIGYWVQNLFVPFVIASTLILLLGKGRFSGPGAYSIRLGAAILIAVIMGLIVGSPWLGTIMVSAATGLLFRYW